MELTVDWQRPIPQPAPMGGVVPGDNYFQIGVTLWRKGSPIWSPLRWCPNAKFGIVPRARCLLLVIGQRFNVNGQLCDVLVGFAEYTAPAPGVTDSVAPLVIKDAFHQKDQIRLQLHVKQQKAAPPQIPGYMIMTAARRTQPPDIIDDVSDWMEQMSLTDFSTVVPVQKEFAKMIRGWIRGPLGQRTPVLEWVQHLSFERNHTHPMYFATLAQYYLLITGVNTKSFLAHPMQSVDILQFLCGHAVWTIPYCRDECLDAKQRFRLCDSWGTGRWNPSVLRAGDCEDNATDLAATFHALCHGDARHIFVPDDPRRYAVLRRLFDTCQALARQYVVILADTVLWDTTRFQLHMYAKLVPKSQWERLTMNQRPNKKEDSLPIFMLDSTRRCWSPVRSPSSQLQTTLISLFNCLRQTGCDCRELTCAECQQTRISMMFEWGTPEAQWQRLSQGLYHTDLRYYDVAAGAVYMPTLGVANAKAPTSALPPVVCGVPAMCLSGFHWINDEVPAALVHNTTYGLPLSHRDGLLRAPVVLTHITKVYCPKDEPAVPPIITGAQPSVEGEEKKEDDKDDAGWQYPPLRSIAYDTREPRVSHSRIPVLNGTAKTAERPVLHRTIPVYIRAVDAIHCVPTDGKTSDIHDAVGDDEETMENLMACTARWLLARCRYGLDIVQAERIYVRDVHPRHYMLVFYMCSRLVESKSSGFTRRK